MKNSACPAPAPATASQYGWRSRTASACSPGSPRPSAVPAAIWAPLTSCASSKGKIIRDITVNARDEEHEQAIVKAITTVPGVKVLRSTDRTFTAHEGGKIEIKNKLPVRDRNDLSKVYTPGVARVCMDIHRNKEHAYRYTMKGNSVAVVSDGTAVLGLGDIGPEAALPVMEGKAMIFKEFADINAFPLVLATRDVDEIVAHGQEHRAGLRRHQPRGHFRAPLLRGRGAAPEDCSTSRCFMTTSTAPPWSCLPRSSMSRDC